MRFETTITDRKLLARRLAEFTGEGIHYLGPPSFAYSVGGYMIARDGAVSTESETEAEALRVFLEDHNLLKPEITEMDVRLPLVDWDVQAMKRLVFLFKSKQYLLNKIVGTPFLEISDVLIAELETTPMTEVSEFISMIVKHSPKGISFEEGFVSVVFPRTNSSDKDEAMVFLIAVMIRKAREAKRVSSKELQPENEKYYARVWLVQMGLDGEENKTRRKALLSGLKGHSAFRTEADAAKFSANQKAKRNARNAQQGGGEDA